MVLRWLVITMTFVGTMGTGALVSATTYFDEDFESTLTGKGWSTETCVTYRGYPSPPPNGCNPSISTDVHHGGTHSLKADYSMGPCADQSCGVWITKKFAETDDKWGRFWYYTTAFTYNPISTKNVYDYTQGGGQPSFVWGHHFGGREIQVDAQNIPSQLCPSGKEGITCSYYPNMASVPLNDGQWYCIETHLKLNTLGQADGILEIFVNHVQTLGYYKKEFRKADVHLDTEKIYVQGGTGLMYYDDFAVGNTRIGCTAAPQSDSVPPTPPIGLQVK